MLGAKSQPNHHLVVFVKKDGKPIENAQVQIRYRTAGTASAQWQALPVARVYVKAKDKSTMHYGNNVHLASGNYAVKVTIDGAPAYLFHLTLSGH